MVYLSIRVMIYLFLAKNDIGNGRYKLECISSIYLHDLYLESTKGYLMCFPRIHASQGSTFLEIVGNPTHLYYLTKKDHKN